MTGTSEVSANTGTGASTVGEWLSGLQPLPPSALAERLTELLKEDLHRPVADVPEVCLHKGEEMLSELVRSGSTERDTALTLLAVDALVTYAFDAASGDPAHIEERAANAMKRIAQLAEG